MKDNKNDSTTVLSRFGRDKRQRTVTATAERVERRPRLQRDAADSEQPSSEGPRGRPPTIPISRRTIALHSTNRAASSATNRLTASVSPAINPVTSTTTATNRAASSATNRLTASVSPAINPAMSTATATNRAASTVTSPPMASANSATNPATSTATATSRAANMADKPAYGERQLGDKKYGDRKFGDKPYEPEPKPNNEPASLPIAPERRVGEMFLNRTIAQSACARAARAERSHHCGPRYGPTARSSPSWAPRYTPPTR